MRCSEVFLALLCRYPSFTTDPAMKEVKATVATEERKLKFTVFEPNSLSVCLASTLSEPVYNLHLAICPKRRFTAGPIYIRKARKEPVTENVGPKNMGPRQCGFSFRGNANNWQVFGQKEKGGVFLACIIIFADQVLATLEAKRLAARLNTPPPGYDRSDFRVRNKNPKIKTN